MNPWILRPVLVLCISGSVGLCLSPAVGEEFSWELAGGYSQQDGTIGVELDRYTLGVRYYLAPVDDTAGPLQLATFLNRSSHVQAGVTGQSQRQRAFEGTALRAGAVTGEESGYEIAARYVWPDSGWFVGGRAERSDSRFTIESQSRELPGSDQETAELGFGKYILPSTTMELTLMSIISTSKPEELVCASMYVCSASIGSEIVTDDVSLSLRHVGRVAAMAYSLSALGGASDSRSRGLFPSLATSGGAVAPAPGLVQELREYFETYPEPELPSRQLDAIWGDIFPTRALGIGLGYSRTELDVAGAPDTGQVHVSTRWFIRRNVALNLSVSHRRREGMSGQRRRETDSLFVLILGRL